MLATVFSEARGTHGLALTRGPVSQVIAKTFDIHRMTVWDHTKDLLR
jgi:hypothetical protein